MVKREGFRTTYLKINLFKKDGILSKSFSVGHC